MLRVQMSTIVRR